MRIVYKAYLSGMTACNYSNRYNGHHFWGLDIGPVMEAAGLSNLRTFTEDIQIGYYSDSKVTLEDPQTSLPLASFGVGLAPGTDAEVYNLPAILRAG